VLKLRILTALILAPLLMWATYALPTIGFGLLAGAFFLVAAWEWAGLCGMTRTGGKAAYVGAIALAGVLLYGAPILPILGAAAAWWTWATFEMLYHRDVRDGWVASALGKPVSGFFVLLPAWLAPLWLHAQPNGWREVVFLLLLVWAADTGAYFVGRPWGRTKIAPQISPGKSLEGVVGGLLAVALLAWGSGLFVWRWPGIQLALWVGLACVVALISVIGDLMESRFKRAVGLKDSSHILPGHGGVLDRIDALTAAAPFFVLGAMALGLV
jgi:phosphatidate cytidylyltransferase